MTLDEMRTTMNSFHDREVSPYDGTKLAYAALLDLSTFFAKFDQTQRSLAEQVVEEWLSSGDPSREYDAQHLIIGFRIVRAVPALRMLQQRYAESGRRGDRDEAGMIANLIQSLEAPGKGDGRGSPSTGDS